MDFNDTHLHETIFNLHTHVWILSRLSIASVDGKQHLSEVRFSSRRIFIVRKMTGSGSYPYTQDSSLVIMVFMKSGSLFLECSMSWVYGYDPEPIIFLTMEIREHYTLPHSNAACHQQMLLTSGRKFTHVFEGSRSSHIIALHWNPPGLCKKKKIRLDTFLTE